MRPKENQVIHDTEVANIASQYVRAGWPVVYSDLPGNNKPPVINGYIPDVYVRNGNAEVVIEIETIDSKNSQQSIAQYKAFKSWADLSPAYRKFLWKVI
ncbi:MAG: hypothetical protein WCV68_01145 [Candidatus Paceibacterota bacterium]|jgi:hypothetical protein